MGLRGKVHAGNPKPFFRQSIKPTVPFAPDIASAGVTELTGLYRNRDNKTIERPIWFAK